MPTTKQSPAAKFAELLSRFPPEIVALTKKCMPKVRRALPGAIELVYDYRKSVVVSFSMSGKGYEGILGLAIYADRVQLYFGTGKSLPDPKGLLEGSGSLVRSLTLASASDLDRADIRALIDAAIAHAGVTLPGARPARMIIMSTTNSRRTSKAVRK